MKSPGRSLDLSQEKERRRRENEAKDLRRASAGLTGCKKKSGKKTRRGDGS